MLGKKLFPVILLSLVTVLLLSIPAQAKGGVVKVVLSGPDWYGELVVDDPALLEQLGTGVFEDVESSPELPANLGPGYLLDRYAETAEGALPFDRVLYFPDPAGGSGYVYYLETVNGHGPYDGRWFLASQEGRKTIELVFERNGVLTRPPLSFPKPKSNLIREGFGLVLPLVGVLIGWMLGRRGMSRRS